MKSYAIKVALIAIGFAVGKAAAVVLKNAGVNIAA